MILALAAFALVAIVLPCAVLVATDVPPDLLQMVQDALAMHSTLGYVLAGVAVVLFLVPIILKALGKSVPLLDPILKIVTMVLSRLVKGRTVEAPPEEVKKEPGAGNVVELKDWPPEGK